MESGSAAESESDPGSYSPLWPGINGGPGSTSSAQTEAYGPNSSNGPMGATKETEAYGPGSINKIPESAPSAGPGGTPERETGPSEILTPGSSATKPTESPAATAPGGAATSTKAPSSPADITISGNSSGPASQATSAAAPAPGM